MQNCNAKSWNYTIYIRTIILIFVVVFPTFWSMFPLAFLRSISNRECSVGYILSICIWLYLWTESHLWGGWDHTTTIAGCNVESPGYTFPCEVGLGSVTAFSQILVSDFFTLLELPSSTRLGTVCLNCK